MSRALYHVKAMAFAVACVVAAGASFYAFSSILDSEDTFQTDDNDYSLDPNDCSRGIDESNQEACDHNY